MHHVARLRHGYLARTLVLGLALAGTAHAQEPAKGDGSSCVASFEQSQVLRRNGQLRAAHEELLKCAQLQCQAAIRNQCSNWLGDVENATPSLIIEVTINGEDSGSVKVSVDGKPADDWSPTKPFELDPGEHVLQVTAPNFPPSEKRIVLREGDKRRAVQFTFGEEKKAGPAARNDTALAPAPIPMHRPVPAVTYVLAGTALVGIGAFTVLGVTAQQREESLDKDCKPECSDSDVDDLKSRYLMANIALGVGSAAALGAIISYFVRPSVPQQDSIQGSLSITPRSASASAVIRF